jgi:hypothetical protein
MQLDLGTSFDGTVWYVVGVGDLPAEGLEDYAPAVRFYGRWSGRDEAVQAAVAALRDGFGPRVYRLPGRDPAAILSPRTIDHRAERDAFRAVGL